MPRLGPCDLCATANRKTFAVLRLDGVPVCRAHARGDQQAQREMSSVLGAPEHDAPLRPEPRLLRRPPIRPKPIAPAIVSRVAEETARKHMNSAPDFVQHLMVLTAEAFGIATGDFWYRSNQRQFVVPRQALVYLLRTHTTLSFPQIANLLKQHHTTPLHSYEVMRSRLRESADLQRVVDGISAAACAPRHEVAA